MEPNPINLNTVFKVLFLLLIPALVFNFEINLTGIGASGEERIGYAGSREDNFDFGSSQAVGIKLFDILWLVLIIFLVGNFVKQKFNMVIPYKPIITSYFIFLLVCLISISINFSLYTSSQFIILCLYFLKLVQILFIPFFCSLFFLYGGHSSQILFVSALTAASASLLGIVNSIIINNYELYLFSSIIPDRVQFYGIILLIVAYISVHFTQIINNKNNNAILISAFVLGIIAIFMCEKRTLLMGLAVLFTYAIFIYRTSVNTKFIMFCLLATGIFMLPFVVDYESTFNRDSIDISAGLGPKWAEAINSSVLAGMETGGLDYSFTERLAKTIFGIQLIRENFFIGTGFWGAPYAHDFIPDNGVIQLWVETGLFGTFFFMLFLYSTIKKSKNRNRNSFFTKARKIMPLIVLTLSLTANTFYMFNMLSLYLIIIISWSEGFNQKIKL